MEKCAAISWRASSPASASMRRSWRRVGSAMARKGSLIGPPSWLSYAFKFSRLLCAASYRAFQMPKRVTFKHLERALQGAPYVSSPTIYVTKWCPVNGSQASDAPVLHSGQQKHCLDPGFQKLLRAAVSERRVDERSPYDPRPPDAKRAASPADPVYQRPADSGNAGGHQSLCG